MVRVQATSGTALTDVVIVASVDPGVVALVHKDLPARPATLFTHVQVAVHDSNSKIAERSWHLIHLDVGSIALCNWYRPPASALFHIDSLREELNYMQTQSIGTLIMGDLNIHQQSWLVHSSGNTPEGEALRNICDDYVSH